jgi:hypothetical protein
LFAKEYFDAITLMFIFFQISSSFFIKIPTATREVSPNNTLGERICDLVMVSLLPV